MTVDPTLAELFERCRHDHAAWITGDGSGYALPDDGTIMGAVGTWSRGGRETAARQSAVAARFVDGEGSVELINGAVAGELAWLAMVERASAVLGRERVQWDLRVTEVFRRTADGDWERVHRHADRMAAG